MVCLLVFFENFLVFRQAQTDVFFCAKVKRCLQRLEKQIQKTHHQPLKREPFDFKHSGKNVSLTSMLAHYEKHENTALLSFSVLLLGFVPFDQKNRSP